MLIKMKEDIIKAFEKSLGEYEDIQKSKHWKKFDARRHLYSLANLENFRNNHLSEGLDDHYSPQEQKKIYESLVSEVGEEYVRSNLTDLNIGNSPDCFRVDGLVVDGGQNVHIKWLYELENAVFKHADIRTVCEIGGGYGSFAQKICAKHKCVYIMIYLPEANLMSRYYLSRHFPILKFLLCNEIEGKNISRKDIEKYDFIIIPPWYKLADDVRVDLFINTRSMMEMNFNVIKRYFKIIQHHISEGGYFFNINRYCKNSVGYPIKFSKYPYDNYWEVIVSKPSWWQEESIHEIITRRIAHKGDIQRELAKLDPICEKIRWGHTKTVLGRAVRRFKDFVNYYRYQYEK